ncbi:MAG: QcrA and Rieske domain-containing protein [Actinomycetota bacterium]
MSTLALSTGLWAALIVLLALNVFAIVFGLSFLRANKAAQAQAAGTPITPSKPVKAVSRRDFFRTSLIVSFAVFAAEFGGATIAFLWPNLKGGFGSVIAAGNIDDILAEIADTGGPVYNGAGRFYLVTYDGAATGDVDYAAEGVAAQGIMPLYQRCVHLGCRVPFCASSKWFECPCHGSKYNEAGEYRLGPAPKGLDRFKITIDEGGNVFVDTSTIVSGPPRGTDTTNQPPQGAFCVAAG